MLWPPDRELVASWSESDKHFHVFRGELASKQIRQVTFDFIDDVSANMTSSCTVLCLLRASPMEDWIPGKKKRVKIYLSLDGPPYHGQYQRRGTVKLADKASNSRESR
eukprot:1321526-Amorphochlora_amoeboformis.AAC.2